MEKGALIGVIVANGAMAYSIVVAGASFSAFYDLPSVIMVVVGGAAAVVIAYPLGVILNVPKVLMKVFMPKLQPVIPVITQLIEFAEIARRDGILALENKTAEI